MIALRELIVRLYAHCGRVRKDASPQGCSRGLAGARTKAGGGARCPVSDESKAIASDHRGAPLDRPPFVTAEAFEVEGCLVLRQTQLLAVARVRVDRREAAPTPAWAQENRCAAVRHKERRVRPIGVEQGRTDVLGDPGPVDGEWCASGKAKPRQMDELGALRRGPVVTPPRRLARRRAQGLRSSARRRLTRPTGRGCTSVPSDCSNSLRLTTVPRPRSRLRTPVLLRWRIASRTVCRLTSYSVVSIEIGRKRAVVELAAIEAALQIGFELRPQRAAGWCGPAVARSSFGTISVLHALSAQLFGPRELTARCVSCGEC